MAFTVTDNDITEWNPFFTDPQVGVTFTAGSSSGGSSTSLSSQSTKYWNLRFSVPRPTGPVQNIDDDELGEVIMLGLISGQPPIGDQPLETVLSKFGVTNTQASDPTNNENLFLNIASKLMGSSIAPKYALDNQDPRNAMWISKGQALRLDTALTFVPKQNVGDLATAIKGALVPGLGLSSLPDIPLPSLVLQQTCHGIKTSMTDEDGVETAFWEVTTTYRLSFKFPASGFIFWISLTPVGMDVSLTKDEASTRSIWNSMEGLGAGLKIADVQPIASFLSQSGLDLKQLTIGWDAGGKVWWKVLITLALQLGNSSSSAIKIYLEYNSLVSTFSGGLITSGFYADLPAQMLPSYRPGIDIDTPDNEVVPSSWSLKSLFSQAEQAAIPNSLPMDITLASVSFTTSTPKTLSFAAQAVHLNPPQGGQESGTPLVPTPFTWDELSVFFSASQGTGPTSISCSLSTHFTILAPVALDLQPADIGVSVSYNSGDWLLVGYAENLTCAHLASFFEHDSSDALSGMLGKLKISYLDLILTHDKTGAASSFLFTGIIDFGELELRLFYQFMTSNAGDNSQIKKTINDAGNSQLEVLDKPTGQNKTSWMFECDLGASTGDATIKDIANSVLSGTADDLPSFIADIKIPKADGTTGRAPVFLKVKKVEDKILFVFRFALGSFIFTFAQVSATGKSTAPPKRLLRFAVDKIPLIDHVPLLNKLPQPFDQMQYVWVGDGGFSLSEVDAINTNLLSGADTLAYKSSVKSDPKALKQDNPPSLNAPPTPNADPQVLEPGHHFIITHDGSVAVDHVFHPSPSPQQNPTPPNNVKPPALANIAPSQTTGSGSVSPPSKGPISFKLGPLSIDGIALQFKDQGGKKALAITMNATLAMGPISFSLLGFGIAIQLDGLTLDKLSSFIDNISVVLSGLALSFNKPPILIAGGFEHIVLQVPGGTEDIYQGGIGIGFPPYTFVGLGEYAVVKVQGQDYKSVFLFAKLDGPIITLEIATISGVRLGLGYNSLVRPPTVEELTSFPFINDGSISGAGNDPMAILHSMTGGVNPWVTPKLDSYWFAAGFTVTAFDILSVTAVAMFAFRDSGLIISLYADAIAQMPPKVPKEAVIVYAEIGMVAEMNFVDGYFRVEAALAPTSFLLVPACHLYGGFALVYWFPPSDHSGDFVFSIGGYHRSYTPPSWYPVPQRLGISFNVDILSITGEAYFAVTPKCVMGGAMLHASLSFGPIEAWLDAAFDALIQFHPLHYSVDFSVTIGVNFNIDVLFVHIHVHAHVGAQLHIEGPEFGGVAHVDFWLLGFDVDFGASPSQPDPLDLLQFWEMMHKPGPDSGDNSKQHEAPLQSRLDYSFTSKDPQHKTGPATFDAAALKFTLEDGNFPMPSPASSSTGGQTSTGIGNDWYVKGGTFTFRVSTDFALSTTTLALSDETIQEARLQATANKEDPTKVPIVRTTNADTSIFSKPMHLTASGKTIVSTLIVKVIRSDSAGNETIDNFRGITMVLKPVPTALWAPYDPNLDPKNKPADLLNGDNPVIPECMAVSFAPPLPLLSPPISLDGHEFFIPKFSATGAAKFGILDFRTAKDFGSDWFVPESEELQVKFLPSALTPQQQAETNVQRWTETKETWNALATKDGLVNGDAAKKDVGILAGVCTLLGWDQKRPATEVLPKTGRMPWELVGSLPKKLIKNLEGTYLELPRVAVV